MTSGELPAVARRRVRLALRDAREASGLTQGQVAEAMEWSLSKVMRIESGEVTISPNDLRPLLGHLGITERARANDLLEAARAARRRRQWSDEHRFRDHLTQATRQLIQYESEATEIRHMYNTIIPGRLQTPEYAQAILVKYRNELPGLDIEVRFEARMRRRNDLLARKERPTIYLLLDESALRREVGGPLVMANQLADLFKRCDEPGFLVRILPYAVDAPLPLFGSYEILDLGGINNAVVYRETYVTDEIVEDPAKVKFHREVFDELWDAALDQATSVRLVEQFAESALNSASRKPPG
jgi:transcriptional regulator with XRE-family HTH domain